MLEWNADLSRAGEFSLTELHPDLYTQFIISFNKNLRMENLYKEKIGNFLIGNFSFLYILE